MVTAEHKVKKPQPGNRLVNFMAASMAVFYTICLVYILFFARRRWVPSTERTFNLVPFREKIHYLRTYASHTHLQNVEFYKDLVGNILLFIPFPFLLFYMIGVKTFSKLFWLSVIASVVIEIIQLTCNIGVADIDDVILNTLGSSIGLLMLYGLSTLRTNVYDRSNGHLNQAVPQFQSE